MFKQTVMKTDKQKFDELWIDYEIRKSMIDAEDSRNKLRIAELNGGDKFISKIKKATIRFV